MILTDLEIQILKFIDENRLKKITIKESTLYSNFSDIDMCDFTIAKDNLYYHNYITYGNDDGLDFSVFLTNKGRGEVYNAIMQTKNNENIIKLNDSEYNCYLVKVFVSNLIDNNFCQVKENDLNALHEIGLNLLRYVENKKFSEINKQSFLWQKKLEKVEKLEIEYKKKILIKNKGKNGK